MPNNFQPKANETCISTYGLKVYICDRIIATMEFWRLLLIIAFLVVGLFFLLNWLGMWDTVYPSIKEASSNGWDSIQEIFKVVFR